MTLVRVWLWCAEQDEDAYGREDDDDRKENEERDEACGRAAEFRDFIWALRRGCRGLKKLVLLLETI